MADESRVLAKGNYDYAPLFDYIKGRQDTDNKKELQTSEHENTLVTQKIGHQNAMELENSRNKFSTILEGLKNENMNQRLALESKLRMDETAKIGAEKGAFAQQQAVQWANEGGPGIPGLVQEAPRPNEGYQGPMRPTATPTLPPAAGEAALASYFDTRHIQAQKQADMEKTAAQRAIDGIDESHVAAAQESAKKFEEYGLHGHASILRNMKPGSYTKTEFANIITDGEKHVQASIDRMARTKVMAEARVKASELNANARLDIQRMKSKDKLDAKDGALIKQHSQQIVQEIASHRGLITSLQASLAAGLPNAAETRNMENHIKEEQAILLNLVNRQSELNDLDNKYATTPPTPGTQAVKDMRSRQQLILDAMPNNKYKGKTIEALRPEDGDSYWETAEKIGQAPKGYAAQMKGKKP